MSTIPGLGTPDIRPPLPNTEKPFADAPDSHSKPTPATQPYFTPVALLDPQTAQSIFELRDFDTGEVLMQLPTGKSAVLPIMRDRGSSEADSAEPPVP